MELGATLCRPSSPQCLLCPLRAGCAGLAAGDPERFPARPARPASIPMLRVALVARRRGRVLLRRRSEPPNEGFLELPDVEVPLRGGEELEVAARPTSAAAAARLRTALERALLREHGLRVRTGQPGRAVRHGIMRWTIRVVPLPGELLAGRVRAPLQWTDPRAPDVPLTTAARRILSAADEQREGRAAGYPRAHHAGAREPR